MEVVIIRKVDLTMNEQKKYEVIKNLLDSDGNKNRAACLLGCSRRTIDRLINSYRLYGKAAFSHGNKGRSPSFALSHAQKKAIVLLYVNKYFDCNISHFTELLARDENIHISQTTARSILLAADILSPKAHKRTKKAFVSRLPALKKRKTLSPMPFSLYKMPIPAALAANTSVK